MLIYPIELSFKARGHEDTYIAPITIAATRSGWKVARAVVSANVMLARAMMQASSTLAHHADGGSLALFVAPLGQDVAKAKKMRPWF